MHPHLLEHPQVASYGVMMAGAWLVGWFLARRRAPAVGVPVWVIDGLMPLLIVGMLGGSRLAGLVAQQWSPGFSNDYLLLGGITIAVLTVVVVSAWTHIPLGRLGDAFTFSLPAGILLLRLGCLMAGCCWGNTCGDHWPLGVTYPTGSPAWHQQILTGSLATDSQRSLPVHPVPLYEAAALLGLLAASKLLDAHWHRWGESFLAFGFSYCVLRFLLEWLRADHVPIMIGLAFSQWASLACAIGCLVLWEIRRRWAASGRCELYRRCTGQTV